MTFRAPFLTAVTFVLLGPAEVRAHDALLRSVPAKDAHLAAAPTSLRLTFSRSPTLALARLTLTGGDDRPISLGALRIDSGATLVADIVGVVEPGPYRVSWLIAGADGHPVRGEFRFTVATGTSVAPADHAAHVPDTSGTPVHHDPVTMPAGTGFGVQSAAYIAIRWIAFTALVLMIGAVAFRLGVVGRMADAAMIESALPRGEIDERLARFGSVTAGTLLVATCARLAAQSLALHGGAEVFDGALLRGLVLQTTWGRAWIVQLLSVMAVIWFLARGGHQRWIGAAAACVGAAVSQAASGHAASVGATGMGADSLHILAAAGWIGGIAAMLCVAVPTAMRAGGEHRFANVAQVVDAFSPMALVCAGLVAFSGAFSAWLHLGALRDLWTSDYGRTLLWKVGVLSLVAATGAYNWKRVRPTVHESTGTARLKRVAGMELAIALMVIAVTAVLVATPPPAMSSAVAVQPPTP